MIKYVEKFLSIQGEGRYAGTPSYFIRMWGCNLRCPKFGRGAPDTYPDVGTLKEFPDLGGCDSAYSWHPKYSKFIKTDSAVSLAKEYLGTRHVVLTGGEPMLNQDKLLALLQALFSTRRDCTVTIETNATIPIQNNMRAYLRGLEDRESVLFSCSPKLPSSGEQYNSGVLNYYLSFNSVLKLVFQQGDEEDIDTLLKTVNKRHNHGSDTYVMAEGSLHYADTHLAAIDYVIKRGLTYSPRLQNIFPSAIGT